MTRNTLPQGLVLALAALSLATAAPAAGPDEGHARAQLLMDTAKIAPAGQFRVGVLFTIDAGWHIYWKDAGETGLPTDVKVTLPQGFAVGPLQWPAPHRFVSQGIESYGYAGNVLLWADVTAPMDLAEGAQVPVKAVVGWLACKDTCVLGGARLSANVAVAATAERTNEALFEPWVKAVPIDAASKESPARVTVTGELTEEKAAPFAIQLDWADHAPQQIDWAPAAGSAIQIKDIAIKSQGKRTLVTFTAMHLKGQDLSAPRMESVFTWTDQQKQTRGLRVMVPWNRK